MKISVITVCFNSEATIAHTLQAVAAQTHPDVEHVIVDGGSRDGTVKLVETLGRNGRVILSEPDKGIYDAMNKGLRLATGDVIGFLNADDMYADDGVLARVDALMQQDRLDALYGDTEFVHPANLNKPVRRYRSDRFRPDRIAWGWMPAHPALFLRRQVFERYGGFRPDYRIAGDFELVARIFHPGELSYRHIPEVLVRMRTGGISTGGLRSTLLLNSEVLRACRENGISSNWLMILSKYPAKLLEYLRK
ncbi:glycosyltransferase family 2 protein [Rhodoferax sp. BAB1]|uniref:glycosyltransferase family 2 protein n=1 Tax=Rhodoferax sp. BAB1 TaxID=2741720 RepID=UPI0015761A00|nr:glycosyltransferase family 2 protein [Rhodoferax sp. BAB1]QKO22970.1 glycosyltransferase [Rhodoferax sp. BAB1]